MLEVKKPKDIKENHQEESNMQRLSCSLLDG
jgi:hypothetical protein